MPEDDISQRDLSHIDETDMSQEERHEMQRRFGDFVTRLRQKAGLATAEKQKPKRITRWDPATISRRH